MILDELPGRLPLPAPPTPSTAEAILRIANGRVDPSIGVRLPTQPNPMNIINFWQQREEALRNQSNTQQAQSANVQFAVKNNLKNSPKKTSTFGASEGKPEDECPICHKFYPNNKKREHFASTHFQVS